ncbi:hypothetical protein DVH24_037928 [Malus domestica]|uniref:PB1-like domain-containing protein n=1 Tax=Malus domestica TaxID=3750 RepID=A0A498JWV9_MALDO|nr:hypothetical protein DVH24_037928 [Malus domestica]
MLFTNRLSRTIFHLFASWWGARSRILLWGKVAYIDYCDNDLMSLLVIDDMVEALGYSEMFMNYYDKIPNMDISNGLKLIQSDADVKKMLNY